MLTDKRTATVRAAVASDSQHGAVIPPLHLSSNFAFRGFDQKGDYDYTRSGNPTRDQLALALAELEGAASGVVTGSGMGAVTLVCQLLSPGDLLLAPHDCYGGCHRLFTALAARGAFELRFIDFSQPNCRRLIEASSPSMVWLETPSNPLLRITDIEAVAEAAHGVGATVIVDNTFLSPALQRPLDLGADLVLHSTTKYLNGHSDVVGGAVVSKDAETGEQLSWWANCLGITGAPFDSYLTLRGLRTLHSRWATHLQNAAEVVELLTAHGAVRKVYYPGLESHPGHAVANRQQAGHGAMISFELEGGEAEVRSFVDHLGLFTLAESLGGVESLVAHPATMTHASMDAAAQKEAGISPQLLRLSVGIESADDLVADLTHALDQCRSSTVVHSLAV
jgi:cystathionine gamma-synthase